MTSRRSPQKTSDNSDLPGAQATKRQRSSEIGVAPNSGIIPSIGGSGIGDGLSSECKLRSAVSRSSLMRVRARRVFRDERHPTWFAAQLRSEQIISTERRRNNTAKHVTDAFERCSETTRFTNLVRHRAGRRPGTHVTAGRIPVTI